MQEAVRDALATHAAQDGALLMEPTETESLQTLDAFATALRTICNEAPELVKGAPHSTAVCRPDEVNAARKPVLCWSAPNC